jgi:hypothetical protein
VRSRIVARRSALTGAMVYPGMAGRRRARPEADPAAHDGDPGSLG